MLSVQYCFCQICVNTLVINSIVALAAYMWGGLKVGGVQRRYNDVASLSQYMSTGILVYGLYMSISSIQRVFWYEFTHCHRTWNES